MTTDSTEQKRQGQRTNKQFLWIRSPELNFLLFTWFNPVFSGFSTLFYARFCTGRKVTGKVRGAKRLPFGGSGFLTAVISDRGLPRLKQPPRPVGPSGKASFAGSARLLRRHLDNRDTREIAHPPRRPLFFCGDKLEGPVVSETLPADGVGHNHVAGVDGRVHFGQ